LKLALLSDIHGNCYALKAVLEEIKRRNIDTLIITGDFVGYYFWPVEVFKLLKGWNVIAIRGNHDKMLECTNNKAYRVKIRKKYGSGLDIALDQLDKKNIEWLMHLPNSFEYETKDGGILLCHGSPWDGDEYIYPDVNNDLLSKYSNIGTDVKWVVQGHTHYPMCKNVYGISIINPGSVGQPRNGQLGAQWALLDTTSGKLKHFCERYEISKVIRESERRHPEIPYLAKILQRSCEQY